MSWHLVTQHATSVTASLIKKRLISYTHNLGAGGRRFKSSRPDYLKQYIKCCILFGSRSGMNVCQEKIIPNFMILKKFSKILMGIVLNRGFIGQVLISLCKTILKLKIGYFGA